MAIPMNERASLPTDEIAAEASRILHAIDHTTHLLPSQGPLTVFVHHNTLHAFEEVPFDTGVRQGGKTYRCQPYLAEQRYQTKREAGRIAARDIDEVLAEELVDEGKERIAGLDSRFELRRARIQLGTVGGSARELGWVVAETDALVRFAAGVSPEHRAELFEQTRAWVERPDGDEPASELTRRVLAQVAGRFPGSRDAAWATSRWTALTLETLWGLCHAHAERFVRTHPAPAPAPEVRPRDTLLEIAHEDPDELVDDVLIPFCAAFCDQGFAQWSLPGRDDGFLASFIRVHGDASRPVPAWRRPLPELLGKLAGRPDAALGSIRESLRAFGIAPEDWEEFILRTALALRGWAGMLWQLESNAAWLPHPAPPRTLVEFLCVRLLLDRLAVEHVARTCLGPTCSISDLGSLPPGHGVNGRAERLAYETFRLAQSLGWSVEKLRRLDDQSWNGLLSEIESFSDIERRKVLHLAFERHYLGAALGAIEYHAKKIPVVAPPDPAPSFQIACCIDEREESFRRAIEELDADCETLGIAGFFGVAMYYRGVAEAHFRPLCPVSISPEHSVVEEPAYSFLESSRRRKIGQARVGQLSHRIHMKTRTLWGGLFTGLAGAVAAVPLVARILFPRSVAILRRRFGSLALPPATELRLDREETQPEDAPTPIGYTTEEMADVVEGALRSMGLTPEHGFSRVVVICGHGSASLNNPQEAAHDCGACGGGRGGPNARAFAQMANDRRVRELLAQRGIAIPDEVSFVGAYHNTCDDSVIWYDLDHLPHSNRAAFEHARDVVETARRRNAHERCRRFESAPLSLSEEAALRHVEARAEDLSQTRPEYGHATNVLCLVGRRDWSRGLFLDRRAFLTSYDPSQDDARGTTLENLLRAVVPVCAGINLEYYFSYVDPTGYGSGTKLPHNISCLLGVMDGARSDLRTGLPWQMVEIHEPVRLQFIIETNEDVFRRILDENPAIARLVEGEWVHVALLDPETRTVRRYRDGTLERLAESPPPLPTASSSLQWYRGRRDHLGFAQVGLGGT